MAGKFTKWPENLPNGRKIVHPESSIERISKICPNWDFWFENKPSGNPALSQYNVGSTYVGRNSIKMDVTMKR
jgi:endo-beta-N-acetylglucosaminidase D